MSNSKKMNILLVLAPLMPTSVPQIGLPYLKAVLKQKGYQVTIDDITPKIAKFSKNLHINNMSDIEVQKSFFYEHERYLNNWAESVIESDFNVVGFSLWQSNIYITKQLIKLIKQKNPQIRIICGGPEHNTLFDLLYDKSVDALVKHEGEETILEIVEAIEKNKTFQDVLGLSYLDQNNIKWTNKDRPIFKNIDMLPFPDFSDLNLESYTSNVIPIMFSRGCNWRCKFCTVYDEWDKFRTRTAKNIFDEILLRFGQYDRKQYKFQLYDSALNQDLKMLSELCDHINSLNLQQDTVTFDGFAKIARGMDFDFLKKMRRAGFNSLSVGLESGCDRVLKLMHKPFNTMQAEKFIRNSFDLDISITATVVVGFPGETEPDWNETIDFLVRNSPYISDILLIYMVINKSMASSRFKDEIRMDYEDVRRWKSKDGLNTFEIRTERLKRLHEKMSKLPIRVGVPLLHYSNR